MGRPGSFTRGVAVSGFSNKSEGRVCENMVISIAINGESLSFSSTWRFRKPFTLC